MSDTDAQKNIEIVKGMLGGVGQEEVMQRLLSEDVVLTVPRGLPYGRDYCGLEGYRSIVGELMACFAEFNLEQPEFAPVGNKVVVISRLKGKLVSGRLIDQPFSEIWEIRNGKVAYVTPFYWDTKEIADG